MHLFMIQLHVVSLSAQAKLDKERISREYFKRNRSVAACR